MSRTVRPQRRAGGNVMARKCSLGRLEEWELTVVRLFVVFAS